MMTREEIEIAIGRYEAKQNLEGLSTMEQGELNALRAVLKLGKLDIPEVMED